MTCITNEKHFNGEILNKCNFNSYIGGKDTLDMCLCHFLANELGFRMD